MKMTDSMREETAAMNQMISSGMLKNVQNPKETFIVPKPKNDVPFLNFAPLQNSIAKLNESAKKFQTASKSKNLSAEKQKNLDEILMKTERFLTSNAGLAAPRLV